MNLYLIKRTSELDYDTYDSAVVVANSEDEAKSIHPDGDEAPVGSVDRLNPLFETWEDTVDKIEVTFLGYAHIDVKRGVVCASFNAG